MKRKTAQRARSLKSRRTGKSPALAAPYGEIARNAAAVAVRNARPLFPDPPREKIRPGTEPMVTAARIGRQRLIEGDSAYRKRFPLTTGLLDYFPDALAAVSEVSFHGNEKHNPGEPMHHARGKSMDHADCILRHLTERGGFDGEIRHTAALAWRALALLQEELERELSLPLPRGAKI
jgi:hypothetical protein